MFWPLTSCCLTVCRCTVFSTCWKIFISSRPIYYECFLVTHRLHAQSYSRQVPHRTSKTHLETRGKRWKLQIAGLSSLQQALTKIFPNDSLCWKNSHYTGIMLNAPTIALCPKLCRHNASNPSFKTPLVWFSSPLSSQSSSNLSR